MSETCPGNNEPFIIPFSEKTQQIASKLKKLQIEVSNEEGDKEEKLFNKIFDFASALRKKYPDAQKYELYHALIGSGVPEKLDKIDFPGDDSIENFINDLILER
jgi:hypothetical protein